MKLVVIIPALNEEKTIADVVRGIPATVAGIEETETIVINDGSTDKTEKRALETGAAVFSHTSPQGLGTVFCRGVEEALIAGADIACTIDGDGQFNPENIPALITPILENKADFVSCSRFSKKEFVPNMPFLKKWGNYGMAWFMRLLTHKPITDAACGFRAYSREVLLHLNLFGRFTYTQETLLNLIFKGLRYTEVPLRVRGEREFGTSRVAGSVVRYAYQTLKIIFRSIRDYKPLAFFGTVGMVLFLVGLSLDGFLLAHYLETGQFTPYKAVGFIGGFFNAIGILIFFVGIAADMLDRIRLTQEKILYFEKKRFYGTLMPVSGEMLREKRLIAKKSNAGAVPTYDT